MILSNIKILECLEKGLININPFDSKDLSKDPFNTSAIDLRLNNEIAVPTNDVPVSLDLSDSGGIANFLNKHSKKTTISKNSPFSLEPNTFILANTFETVGFPLNTSGICYSARVEGRSSIARCGVLVHFTAPTIHANFRGRITLEIINLGPFKFLLTPMMPICQLIIEEVREKPAISPNQFMDQDSPEGKID